MGELTYELTTAESALFALCISYENLRVNTPKHDPLERKGEPFDIPTTLVVGFAGVEKNSELQCLRYYVIMVMWRCDAK